MKSVSTPSERLRSGRSGVYYHTSYLGTPHDYLWLCTTPPALMYHELKKSYDCGADRYWLLNVGDIKPAELDIQTFFDMAWDFDSFSQTSANCYQAALVADWCGESYRKEIQHILDEYYRLAWIRKPEYMGWEIEWDSPETRDVGPTDFSFSNYEDAWKRIYDYKALSARTDGIMQSLPDSLRVPFFEMIGYPVLASEMMNRKFLFAQLNSELAADNDMEGANYAALLSTEAADSIESLNRIYNSLENNKWNGMMTVPPGFCAKYQNRPQLRRFDGVGDRIIHEELGWQTNDGTQCRTLDLRKATTNNGARIIDGFGYDGYILELGDPTANINMGDYAEAHLEFDANNTDRVTLQIFHIPYFPLHEGRGCKIGVSIDGGNEQIIEFLPEEWSSPWKLNVLRNSALSEVIFTLDKNKQRHSLSLRAIDPGMAIQRIVIDEGGFRPGYVGPDLKR